MRVRVDEAGGDVAVGGVDDAPAAERARRADGRDPVAAHGDVAAIPGVAAAVDDAAAGDDEVVMESGAPPMPRSTLACGGCSRPPISKTWYGFSHGGPAQA